MSDDHKLVKCVFITISVTFENKSSAEQAYLSDAFSAFPGIKLRFGKDKREEKPEDDSRDDQDPKPENQPPSIDPFSGYGDIYEPVDLFGGSKRPASTEGDDQKPSKTIRFDSKPTEPKFPSFGEPTAETFKITRTVNVKPPSSQKPESSNPFGSTSNPFGVTGSDESVFQKPALIPKRVEKRNSPSPDPAQSSSISSFMKKKGDSRPVLFYSF